VRDSRLQLAALLCHMLVPVHFLEMDDKGGEILIKASDVLHVWHILRYVLQL
jgi:hypothetical protein